MEMFGTLPEREVHYTHSHTHTHTHTHTLTQYTMHRIYAGPTDEREVHYTHTHTHTHTQYTMHRIYAGPTDDMCDMPQGRGCSTLREYS